MTPSTLRLVLVATPIGSLGSGRGGGVELTMSSLIQGLLALGHQLVLVAPEGSLLPSGCSEVEMREVVGVDQPSWQHAQPNAPVIIPSDAVLPRLWEHAIELGKSADAVLNFSYDWLPIWLTPRVKPDLFHLISMGGVSRLMQKLIEELSRSHPYRLAFHTHRQASDFALSQDPIVVGNGFDLANYELQIDGGGPLGWAGRVAPEKGLEDAVAVATALGERLLVWGLIEDASYAASVEASVASGTIEWRGFLPTAQFQKQLGVCRVLLNTPKWNEAYGNVVVEALACGVPVVAYDRGGPGELIDSGSTGWLVSPDDVLGLRAAVSRVNEIDRHACRKWVELSASKEVFARRVVKWILSGIEANNSPINSWH